MRRYVTLDVFTDRRFGGNPLAVVLEAEGLSTAQMQAITREFNYSETSFVLPPADPAHHAQVRIFTPETELPFAGHPNVGTAFALAREAERQGATPPAQYLFEEGAGLVPVTLLAQGSRVQGAELAAPQPLSRRDGPSAADAARCIGLQPGDIAAPPVLAGVGLPFLVVQLVDGAALERAVADRAAFLALAAQQGLRALYAYVEDGPQGLRSRCFIGGLYEDPATGSATAAVTALLLDLRGGDAIALQIRQGVEMGRPSLLRARAERRDGVIRAWVGGDCVSVMRGEIDV